MPDTEQCNYVTMPSLIHNESLNGIWLSVKYIFMIQLHIYSVKAYLRTYEDELILEPRKMTFQIKVWKQTYLLSRSYLYRSSTDYWCLKCLGILSQNITYEFHYVSGLRSLDSLRCVLQQYGHTFSDKPDHTNKCKVPSGILIGLSHVKI